MPGSRANGQRLFLSNLGYHLGGPDDRPGHDVPGLALTDWLIDKSALVRLGTSPDGAEWASRIGRGLVRITTVTRLEIGYSAGSGTDLIASVTGQPAAWLSIPECPDCLHSAHRVCGTTAYSPSWRAMSMRWTSLVPSPISRIFASR
jgi:hypothetical protein